MAVAARPGPSDARVPCPLCGGLIHPIAGKCKHCKADLTAHRALTYAYSAAPHLWRLVGPDGDEHEVRVAGQVIANSGELLIASAVAGLGLVLQPDFMMEPEITAGHLVRVLPDYEGPLLDTWAVYPSRRHLSAKVRLFVDHLVESFAVEGASTPASRG